VPDAEKRLGIVVILVVDPVNAGIVSRLTNPTAVATDCRAESLTSTSLGTPMELEDLTVAEIVAGKPLGVALPNSGTSGI